MKSKLVFIAMTASLFAACSSAPKKKTNPVADALPKVEINSPVELKLKAEPDRKELMMYISRTRIENMQSGQKVQDSTDETKFTTESSWKLGPEGLISLSIATADKEGKLDLNQIALPEFGKAAKMMLTPQGRVVTVMNTTRNSIFYVSPVSLPAGPVNVGDTWASRESWVSASDGTPMVMDMVSIFRGVVTCGAEQCADIEMSGDVDVQGGLQNVSFKSHWTGNLLFAINTGTVIWSRTDSLETLQAENAQSRVHSCLESVLIGPENLRLASVSTPKCDPAGIPAEVKP